MKEVYEKLPQYEPKFLDKLFEDNLAYVMHCSKDPEIFQVRLPYLGTLTSNMYMNRYTRSPICKERYDIMEKEKDKKHRIFTVPYVGMILKNLFGQKQYSLVRKYYADSIQKIAYATNKKFAKYR